MGVWGLWGFGAYGACEAYGAYGGCGEVGGVAMATRPMGPLRGGAMWGASPWQRGLWGL